MFDEFQRLWIRVRRVFDEFAENNSNLMTTKPSMICHVGVRGSPERDMLFLGAIGRGPGRFPGLFAYRVRFCCLFKMSVLFLRFSEVVKGSALLH